jgi:NAD(P)-dependent dehydrogenase (short-subunit alcohol dehydrogenase family)
MLPLPRAAGLVRTGDAGASGGFHAAAMHLSELLYKPGLLQGQRLLVTGGGTGLGLAMAEAFLMLGAEVFICGRRGGVLAQAAQDLMASHGGIVHPMACDIRDPQAIATMLDHIWAEAPLTGLVNNAAGNFISRTEDVSPKGFDAIANTVLRGSFCLTLECGRRWLAAGHRASVLSIVTTWVFNGSAYVVPAAMAKAGLHAMTQSLAVEWGPRGIRFNAIAPGSFPTQGMSARLDPQGRLASLGRNPMGRCGHLAELANLAVFLMAPGAEYVNGQTIAIDGAQYQANGSNLSGLAGMADADWAQVRAAIQAHDAAERTFRAD